MRVCLLFVLGRWLRAVSAYTTGERGAWRRPAGVERNNNTFSLTWSPSPLGLSSVWCFPRVAAARLSSWLLSQKPVFLGGDAGWGEAAVLWFRRVVLCLCVSSTGLALGVFFAAAARRSAPGRVAVASLPLPLDLAGGNSTDRPSFPSSGLPSVTSDLTVTVSASSSAMDAAAVAAAAAAAASFSTGTDPAFTGPDGFRQWTLKVDLWLLVTSVPDAKLAPVMLTSLADVAVRIALTMPKSYFVSVDGAAKLMALLGTRFGGQSGAKTMSAYNGLHRLTSRPQ